MGDAIKQIVKIRNSKSYVDFANYHKKQSHRHRKEM